MKELLEVKILLPTPPTIPLLSACSAIVLVLPPVIVEPLPAMPDVLLITLFSPKIIP